MALSLPSVSADRSGRHVRGLTISWARWMNIRIVPVLPGSKLPTHKLLSLQLVPSTPRPKVTKGQKRTNSTRLLHSLAKAKSGRDRRRVAFAKAQEDSTRTMNLTGSLLSFWDVLWPVVKSFTEHNSPEKKGKPPSSSMHRSEQDQAYLDKLFV
jgi:hypothetical protein